MTRSYRVHEFAKLAGVTGKALRHYDRLGLLKPLRTAAGYRAYQEKDLGRLEQIVALKFIGLPLRQINRVLDRGTPLSEALLGQRTALEEKRSLLDRAVRAIRSVEGVLASGAQPDSATLKQLIEVISMQNNLQTMKQYYSDRAWAKMNRLRRQHADTQRSGTSESWKKVFREAKTLLGEDPASDKAQDFCNRWFDLLQSTTAGDSGILRGHKKAWADRANWPSEIQKFVGDFDAKAVGDFISKACAASMKKYYSARAWKRKTSRDSAELKEAWKALWSDIRTVLNQSPSSRRGQILARRWLELSALSTQGDRAVETGAKRAWKDREHWPSPMRQYVEKERVPEIAEWIGRAIRALRKKESQKTHSKLSKKRRV